MMWTRYHLDAVGNNHSNSDHGGESIDGSYIVEVKFHLNKLSWLKVTGVKCCSFRESRNFCCVIDCTL